MTQERLNYSLILILIFVKQELASSIDYDRGDDEFKHLIPCKKRLLEYCEHDSV